jgi:transcriptional regulator GlxA family with amidase domain
VLYLRRPGTQSQFSAPLAAQLSDRAPIRELQAWLSVNWHLHFTIDTLAARTGMSPRHFARVFATAVGTTPARYVDRLRVSGACFRLSESSHGLDRIAADCGYASADVMRHAFLRVLRVNPEDYRARFRAVAPRSAPAT